MAKSVTSSFETDSRGASERDMPEETFTARGVRWNDAGKHRPRTKGTMSLGLHHTHRPTPEPAISDVEPNAGPARIIGMARPAAEMPQIQDRISRWAIGAPELQQQPESLLWNKRRTAGCLHPQPQMPVALANDPIRLFILRKNGKPSQPLKLPPLQSYSLRPSYGPKPTVES